MENIFHRVSIRKYQDKPVEKEKIMQILKAGMQAPSACNQQPWEFYVVTDKEKIEELSKATPYSRCAAGAPVVIVPVYRTKGLVVQDMAQIDMSIAQENIWLETDALGLGGVWIGIAPMQDRMDLVHDMMWKSFLCLHWDIRQKKENSRTVLMRHESTLSKNKGSNP